MGSSSTAEKNTYHLAGEKHLLSRVSTKKTFIAFLARKTTKIQQQKNPCKISLLLGGRNDDREGWYDQHAVLQWRQNNLAKKILQK